MIYKNTKSYQPTKTPFCKICYDAKRPGYDTHFIRSSPRPDGVVVCPYLLSLNCVFCGQSGHTISYCTLKSQENSIKSRETKSPTNIKKSVCYIEGFESSPITIETKIYKPKCYIESLEPLPNTIETKIYKPKCYIEGFEPDPLPINTISLKSSPKPSLKASAGSKNTLPANKYSILSDGESEENEEEYDEEDEDETKADFPCLSNLSLSNSNISIHPTNSSGKSWADIANSRPAHAVRINPISICPVPIKVVQRTPKIISTPKIIGRCWADSSSDDEEEEEVEYQTNYQDNNNAKDVQEESSDDDGGVYESKGN
jgi:hypothetical protein